MEVGLTQWTGKVPSLSGRVKSKLDIWDLVSAHIFLVTTRRNASLGFRTRRSLRRSSVVRRTTSFSATAGICWNVATTTFPAQTNRTSWIWLWTLPMMSCWRWRSRRRRKTRKSGTLCLSGPDPKPGTKRWCGVGCLCNSLYRHNFFHWKVYPKNI